MVNKLISSHFFARGQESSAMQRCARGWPRTRHQYRCPLLYLLPLQPANPCKNSRSTGLKSLGPTPGAQQTSQRKLERAAPLANHCAPSKGRMAKWECEVQAWRIGNITEVWILVNSFHHSGEPDRVARNRIFPQGHQNNLRKKKLLNHELKQK